ncbi:hypothetical protein ACTDI4_17985 [Mesorhizobium sp. PUT5]|uniref:hypothetical protein n=1 Tax=Mesorhizobium sp. PUT5 TaxID=3454629 RepID=UPI003FA405E8
MTAVNVFLRRDRGFVMTDAAMYLSDGTVVGFGQKAVAMPGLNSVIACRGSQMATALIAMDLAIQFRTFDEMAESASVFLRNWHDSNLIALANIGAQDINVIVAGWSEEFGRPMGFCFDSRTDDFDTMDSADDWWVTSPCVSDEEERNLHSIGCELEVDVRGANFDPIRHGIPYMEAQRRMKIDGYSDISEDAISLVGGNILLSEITQHGISQRVIHSWPDEIGEPIAAQPFRSTAQGTVVSMSRQQRRAMERAQRKIKA